MRANTRSRDSNVRPRRIQQLLLFYGIVIPSIYKAGQNARDHVLAPVLADVASMINDVPVVRNAAEHRVEQFRL